MTNCKQHLQLANVSHMSLVCIVLYCICIYCYYLAPFIIHSIRVYALKFDPHPPQSQTALFFIYFYNPSRVFIPFEKLGGSRKGDPPVTNSKQNLCLTTYEPRCEKTGLQGGGGGGGAGICVFVFAYGKSRFSHNEAQLANISHIHDPRAMMK